MDQVLQQLGIDRIFSAPYHPQCYGKLEVFHKYLKSTLKNRSIGPELMTAKTGPIHLSSFVEIAFVD